MTSSQQQYSPWERTESEDDAIQTSLNSATRPQQKAFLKGLVELARSKARDRAEDR